MDEPTISRVIRLFVAVIFLIFPVTFVFSEDGQQEKPGRQAQEAVLFISGRDGYHTYRIPSLIVTTKGTLLAFCEGRKGGRGDSGNIDMLIKRWQDGGRTWSEQQVIWDSGDNTCGNPCPVIDHGTGTIFLLMTWNRGDDRESQIIRKTGSGTRRVFISRLEDVGKTWSEAIDITASVKRPEWRWYAT